MDFTQSNTYINLINALDDCYRNSGKHYLFSQKAHQDDLIQISFLFATTSRNNEFMAERLRRELYGGNTSTLDNLVEASNDSLEESNEYREYSRIAMEEGYDRLASLFNGIANIRLNHNSDFSTLVSQLRSNELLCKPNEALWICLGCGNILSGMCAPERCPICGYPQGYYELLSYL
ncbi:MAG TPA: rubrerythrin family protein [Clostridiales bacterium]|nr:rubrerythrin family protein [Clostridiales bacterium]